MSICGLCLPMASFGTTPQSLSLQAGLLLFFSKARSAERARDFAGRIIGVSLYAHCSSSNHLVQDPDTATIYLTKAARPCTGGGITPRAIAADRLRRDEKRGKHVQGEALASQRAWRRDCYLHTVWNIDDCCGSETRQAASLQLFLIEDRVAGDDET